MNYMTPKNYSDRLSDVRAVVTTNFSFLLTFDVWRTLFTRIGKFYSTKNPGFHENFEISSTLVVHNFLIRESILIIFGFLKSWRGDLLIPVLFMTYKATLMGFPAISKSENFENPHSDPYRWLELSGSLWQRVHSISARWKHNLQ